MPPALFALVIFEIQFSVYAWAGLYFGPILLFTLPMHTSTPGFFSLFLGGGTGV
jgi:hypothetical protein